MNLDLNFLFPGLLGFWQIDGQNALVHEEKETKG